MLPGIIIVRKKEMPARALRRSRAQPQGRRCTDRQKEGNARKGIKTAPICAAWVVHTTCSQKEGNARKGIKTLPRCC